LAKGYNNKILRVNLTEGKTTIETPTDEFERKWLGGAGFETYFLFTETKPGIDHSAGKQTHDYGRPPDGYNYSGSSRNNVVTKSP